MSRKRRNPVPGSSKFVVAVYNRRGAPPRRPQTAPKRHEKLCKHRPPRKGKKKEKGRRRRREEGEENAQLYISLTRGFSPRGVGGTLETLDPEAPREVGTSRGPNFPDFEIFENPRVYVCITAILGLSSRGC